MVLVISGVVILLVGSFVAWKLLHKGEPSAPAVVTPEEQRTAKQRLAHDDTAPVAPPQTLAAPPVAVEAEPAPKLPAVQQPAATVQKRETPKEAPVEVHVEPLHGLSSHKAAETAKVPGTQHAPAMAPETAAHAKVETEDWLGFVPSLTAKGGDDDDTELVLEVD
jgi:hypothetical protein